METNLILAQSEPAQTSISESVTAANPASADPTDTNPAPAAPTTENPAPAGSEAPLPAAPPSEPSLPEPLYSQSEANDIVRILTSEGLLDPEYILLFGSLAGGKPHSEAVSYDLLVVVRDIPAYDWWHAKHDLRCKLPFAFRRIPYVNIYVVRLSDAEMRQTPFLYFAHRDGALLYCRDTYRFRRPKRSIDFSKPYYRASAYYDTFKSMADTMLAMAMTQRHALPGQIRAAAYIAAQAAITYYRVLYYVYHNEEFACDDIPTLHERMRLLSTELMLLFDDTHVGHNTTLGSLRRAARMAMTAQTFTMRTSELQTHLERVARLGEIVEKCCRRRLGEYEVRCAK